MRSLTTDPYRAAFLHVVLVRGIALHSGKGSPLRGNFVVSSERARSKRRESGLCIKNNTTPRQRQKRRLRLVRSDFSECLKVRLALRHLPLAPSRCGGFFVLLRALRILRPHQGRQAFRRLPLAPPC